MSHPVSTAGLLATAALLAALATAVPASAAAAPDACRVVGRSDAAKAVGTPIVSVTSRPIGPSSTCTLRGVGAFKSVLVTTYGWASLSEAQTAFRSIVAQTSQMMHPSIPLHGLGDEAQQIGPNVYVRKGLAGYVFNVIDGSTGSAKASKTLALAKTAMVHAP